MNRNQALKRYKAIQTEFGIYRGAGEPEHEKLLEDAWVTNLQRDEIERNSPYRATSDCPFDSQLRTAITALWAGIAEIDKGKTQSGKECIAEAMAMVQWVEAQLRTDINDNQ